MPKVTLQKMEVDIAEPHNRGGRYREGENSKQCFLGLGRMSKNCLMHFIYIKKHLLWTFALVDLKEIKRNIQGVTDERRARHIQSFRENKQPFHPVGLHTPDGVYHPSYFKGTIQARKRSLSLFTYPYDLHSSVGHKRRNSDLCDCQVETMQLSDFRNECKHFIWCIHLCHMRSYYNFLLETDWILR